MSSGLTAEGKFNKYYSSTVVNKAKEHALWTVPSIMVDPNEAKNGTQQLHYDYQSAGALLVNNLTSKLAGTLFPTGRPSFKIDINSELTELAKGAGVSLEDVRRGASALERKATDQLFKNASLSKLYQAIKLLLVTGNALLYRDPDRQEFLCWNMHSYVVKRDAYAKPVEVILKQVVELQDVPHDWQQAYKSQNAGAKGDTILNLYTEIVWDWQLDIPTVYTSSTLENVPVGVISSYPVHLCPFVLLAWNVQIGEHYGRSYVEEYAGDFAKQSLLSEQLGLYELESMRLLNLVDPQSGGDTDQLQEASTGQFVTMTAKGVTAYDAGDFQKMQAIASSLQEVFQRLSRAFMYNGMQRQAERVTAEEVREIANEAESLFGGNYSVLAENLQAPLAYLTMFEVAMGSASAEAINSLIQGEYRPVIMTGLKALTQNAETQNLLRAVQEISVAIGLTQMSQLYDGDKIIELILQNNSVDSASLEKSPEQLQAEQEQQQAMMEAKQEGTRIAQEGMLEQAEM